MNFSKVKKFISIALVGALLFTLSACQKTTTENNTGTSYDASQTVRKYLIEDQEQLYDPDITPQVPAYDLADDLSNVINIGDFSWLGQEELEALKEYGFVVRQGYNYEFCQTYETNRYNLTPNFITTDSIMHTYHLYFSKLLKGLEKNRFSDDLKLICDKMADASLSQAQALSGTEWQTAALRNAAYFQVAQRIYNPDAAKDPLIEEYVSAELALIEEAAAIDYSPVLNIGMDTPDYQEDYSQYKPRGYYAGDEQLEKYFKVMMWFGRMAFLQSSQDHTRSALLAALALKSDPEAMAAWDEIYTITGFFTGTSDDPGVWEYGAAADQAYGTAPEIATLPDKNSEWKKFCKLISEIEPPTVNSIPINDEEGDNVKSDTYGFRFMGQRTTLDADIFQNLVYSRVKENSEGAKRMLPSCLDIPAAFGSSTASDILREEGAEDYKGYTENMADIRSYLAEAPDTLWNATLYNGWINALRPLTESKGEGYPQFMQSDKWNRKNLSSFLGSWTELKHDTVLYSKQVYAEMGGGDEETKDDRGYVEPENQLYGRLASLIKATISGLDSYGVLEDADREDLTLMETLAANLMTISEKELRNELLTDEEYELIRSYGGQLEHLWANAVKEGNEEYIDPLEHPSALITDVATDPNGSVLEAATGILDDILVIVEVEGKLKIASGAVFSFYEFEQPLSERMTDDEWHEKLGINNSFDEKTGTFIDKSEYVPRPDWVYVYETDN